MTFKDHFSSQSQQYSQYRPTYPSALFDFLASTSPHLNLAWDCATGSGQAAQALAYHFDHVIATDASENQIKHAIPHPKISYLAMRAENTDFETESIDLVTVAQALHWFNQEKFFDEVNRVLRPNGVLSVWSYALLTISTDIDSIISTFYNDKLGSFWAPERKWIEKGIEAFSFPFKKIDTPSFKMTASWNLDQLVGYINTWSAVVQYQKIEQSDPTAELREALLQVWGMPDKKLEVSWPLSFYAGRKIST